MSIHLHGYAPCRFCEREIEMSHDFVFWGLMIGTAGAFGTVIAALIWLFFNARNKKRGEK